MNDMSTPNLQARERAYAAIAGQVVTPTAIIEYQSAGRLLVIGPVSIIDSVSAYAAPLQVTVIATEAPENPTANVVVAGHRPIHIVGHLGDFAVTIEADDAHSLQVLKADMVLDARRLPGLVMDILPPGYLTCVPETEALRDKEAECQELVGQFEKPRYFAYDSSLCAHSRSGLTGCNRCIQACPAEAITDDGEGISVDPYLCQGGGACASVCPSGAIRYRYPPAADTQSLIRTLIKTYVENGGSSPLLVLTTEQDQRQLQDLPPDCLLLCLEELASAGPEIYLSALAYGARQVLLFDGGSVPNSVHPGLQEQVRMCQAILEGLGYPAEAIQLTANPQPQAVMPDIQRAGFAAQEDKRTVMYMAIDHLGQQATTPSAVIALPAGAMFGRIAVDDKACTLCMACTSLCPVSAVTAGNGVPQLNFRASACVQCGLCARGCPEQAISLHAELVVDQQQRQQTVVLKQDEPYCCISCGKAFATESVINNILGKLQGHPMFQESRQQDRLRMCEDCRVVDMAEDPQGGLMS